MTIVFIITTLALLIWNIVLSVKIKRHIDGFNKFISYCNALFNLQSIINNSTGTLLQLMPEMNVNSENLNAISEDLNKMFDKFQNKKEGELPTLDNLVEGDPDE